VEIELSKRLLRWKPKGFTPHNSRSVTIDTKTMGL
jgi:hypothetical protein